MPIGEIKQMVELVVFIITAVWAISKIKSTTEKLSISMDHLSEAMRGLDYRVERVRGDLVTLGTRITRIETKLEVDPASLVMIKSEKQ